MPVQDRILVVEDDPMTLEFMKDCLESEGLHPDAVPDGIAADQLLKEHSYRLVVSDVKLPGMDGLSLLARHGGGDSMTRFLMVSGQSTIQDAVEAMKRGAYDFLAKPFRPKQLQQLVERALSHTKYQKNLKGTVLIGESSAFRRVVAELDLVKDVPTTVLLTGETGTGKEVAARYLHEHGTRAKGPFVSLHCGAVPDNLLEDELFGHVKGAFTGAVSSRPGCFEMADGGTLFLDEIGTMSLSLQAKLLRVLQEPEIRRLGDTKSRRVDVRLVAATNANLEQMVRDGEFRADLYYRLSVFPIHLPRLEDRESDVVLLGRHFAGTVAKKLGMPAKTLSPEAEQELQRRSWPGNVRELENAIERAVVVSRQKATVEVTDLARTHKDVAVDPVAPSSVRNIDIPADGISFDSVVGELERQLILKSLELSNGNKKQAAELLRLKRTTLIEKLKRLDGVKRAS
jgi:DNA-binding NtrC family response regulator